MKNRDIKFVFFGTPQRAVRVLDILKENELIPALIVTQPDAPKGRGQKSGESEVKVWAKENSIPTLEPEKLDQVFAEELGKVWDLFVVVAYGKILPEWLLDFPARGTLNIHFSLLPLFRGPTPIETQILEGVEETGVTIMLVDEKMDHGPIVSQEFMVMPDPLPSNDELVEELSNVGGRLLAETIPDWVAGEIVPQNQEHDFATYTKKFSKEEAEIDLNGDPVKNLRKIKAFSSWPRAYFFVPASEDPKVRVIVTDAHIENEELVLDRVIPEGKKEMSWSDFKRNL